jgi:hypothetical protein
VAEGGEAVVGAAPVAADGVDARTADDRAQGDGDDDCVVGELFTNYERYAWRLETRDVYAVGEEDATTGWLAGRKQPPTERTTDWSRMISANRAQRKPISRVRLVGRPVTLYTAWEVAAYRDNIEAGEDVRLLNPLAIADDLNPLWDMDFWLFDDRTVAIMHYDRAGGFHGACTPREQPCVRRDDCPANVTR